MSAETSDEHHAIPRRLAVLGCGLLGTSVALAAKAARPDCHTVGFDVNTAALKEAEGQYDQLAASVGEALDGADAVCIATNVLAGPSVLEEIATELLPRAVIFDTLSTKRSIVEAAELVLPAPVRFVGSHPMAGGERRGPGAARPDLFRGAPCFVTPNATTDEEATLTVEAIWQALGATTTRVYPSHHDRIVASISHMPHVMAAALLRQPEDVALRFIGPGFRDATRIGAGDAALWADILTDNRDEVLLAMHECVAELQNLARLLQQDEIPRDRLIQWLDEASKRRASALSDRAPTST